MQSGGPQARAAAARAVSAVLDGGQSLAASLPRCLRPLGDPGTRALAQELTYGCLRHEPRLRWFAGRLLTTPPAAVDSEVLALILVGLYQIDQIGTPAHVAVSVTVEACRTLGRARARGLVNAVLRNFLRRRPELTRAADADPPARHRHPRWLIDTVARAWPAAWPDILAANNARPPMTLRVNARNPGRDAYLRELASAGIQAAPTRWSPDGVVLRDPVRVDDLPGFRAGQVSVQDEAAQLAAPLLDALPAQRVLDACAAPGGKSAHLLERVAGIELVAVEAEAERLITLRDTLQRLGLTATVIGGDAADPGAWWDGRAFDRILLDAPCTATGVIRRHPDIKALRRPTDVAATAALQARLLDALWSLLQGNGKLLYATCSLLPAENQDQIRSFLGRRPDAVVLPIETEWGIPTDPGRQILPGQGDMDGFFYALLQKRA
jgi:16S rRNA (cytosine967-C5)-methyltransferase